MELEEFENRLTTLEAATRPAVINFAEAGANDLIKQIKSRLINKGESADGGKFTPYSTKTTLIGSSSFTHKTHADKVFGSKAKRKELQWRTVKGRKLALLPGGYKKIREIEGRQTGHKSFFRRGDTLNSLAILARSEKEGDPVVKIGVKPEYAPAIIGNTEREGIHILLPNDSEKQVIAKAFIDQYVEVIKEHLYD